SPAAFEDFFRRQGQCRILALASLDEVLVKGNEPDTTAPALSPLTVPFIGQKMFERGEEEGAEAPAFAVHVLEVVHFQKALEETLREVLGGFLIVSRASIESVERVPIGAAELFERIRSAVCGG